MRGTNILKSVQWYIHRNTYIHFERFFTVGGVHYRRYHCNISLCVVELRLIECMHLPCKLPRA